MSGWTVRTARCWFSWGGRQKTDNQPGRFCFFLTSVVLNMQKLCVISLQWWFFLTSRADSCRRDTLACFTQVELVWTSLSVRQSDVSACGFVCEFSLVSGGTQSPGWNYSNPNLPELLHSWNWLHEPRCVSKMLTSCWHRGAYVLFCTESRCLLWWWNIRRENIRCWTGTCRQTQRQLPVRSDDDNKQDIHFASSSIFNISCDIQQKLKALQVCPGLLCHGSLFCPTQDCQSVESHSDRSGLTPAFTSPIMFWWYHHKLNCNDDFFWMMSYLLSQESCTVIITKPTRLRLRCRAERSRKKPRPSIIHHVTDVGHYLYISVLACSFSATNISLFKETSAEQCRDLQ